MDGTIIGAIIGVCGVFLGIIFDRILNCISNKKRLNITNVHWNVNLLKADGYGGVTNSKVIDDKVMHLEYSCGFDVYNGSNISKIMHRIEIVIIGENDEKIIYKNPMIKEVTQDIDKRNIFTVINILPKMIKKIEISDCEFDKKKMFDIFVKTKEVFLKYENEKNNTKEVLVYKKD